jgi:hypothetical protein
MKLRWLRAAATILLVRCGGKAHSPDAPPAGSGSGGVTASGGSLGQAEGGTGGRVNGNGGSFVSTGGVTFQGGVAGVPTISVPPDAFVSSGGAGVGGAAESSCQPEVLWVAVVDGALGGLGSCDATSVPGAGEKSGRLRGAVVLDSDGRVIDNTGLSGSEKQTWLDKLGNQRWRCLAGQTIGYTCNPAA